MAEANARERRHAARRMVQRPLLCVEQDPDDFALVRRHEAVLDQWFARRLGYRLSVTSTTARLSKTTVLPHRRALTSVGSTPRPLVQRELVLLTLVLAAVAAGPRVVSLRDLVTDARVAAVDADVTLGDESVDRRALVTVLRWMIEHGLARELHEDVGRYEADADADAVLEFDPDRIALLPLPALARADTADELLDRGDARTATRQWLRARLLEDPVLYREDLSEREWSELRRRVGEDAALLDEMFGLRLEVRAEGIAAIDPADRLSDQAFPSTRTLNHAGLLLIDAILARGGEVTRADIDNVLADLVVRYAKYWSKALTSNPQGFAERVLHLLDDFRLLEYRGEHVALRPAAARFAVEVSEPVEIARGVAPEDVPGATPDRQGDLF